MRLQGVVELSNVAQILQSRAAQSRCRYATEVEVEEAREESSKEALPQLAKSFLGRKRADGFLYIGAIATEQTGGSRTCFAVITYLRGALEAKVLTSDLSPQRLRTRLKKQYERWWSINVDTFESKKHFLRYAGRYVRRPPIAQHRFVKITDREVQFWTKDKILKRRVNISYTPEEFVAILAEHVPDRYQHGIRYFGLLAPRAKARTSAAVFTLLGQQKRPRPPQLGWAFLLRRDFGKDPLIDRRGQPMRWVGRLMPCV